MLQQKIIRRLLAQRASRSPMASRTFIHHITYTPNSRPQLPFLSTPSKKPVQARYLTTETKKWIKHEVLLGFRYTFVLWGVILGVLVIYWSVNQEVLERKFPSPHEWSFLTRVYFRGAIQEPNRPELLRVDWVRVIDTALKTLRRLEDPNVDGADVKELVEGSVYIDGVGKLGLDITAKSEEWRRGYYETLMLTARAAEQLDGHVVDKIRRYVFPADMVLGPSNPHPKPIPLGAPSAPKEEDCEPAYEPAENWYLRILTTKGFNSKQKMDAALAYASFMDFKKMPDAAESMYRWALAIATEDLPEPLPYDPETLALDEKAGNPSANLITALTAFATHMASAGDVSAALPIFASVLKARRNLPDHPPPSKRSISRPSLYQTILKFIQPPAYPPPPPDGTSPPWRDPQELCEEAGLGLYIGEILFATRDQEGGIAWTREAVDGAEEQLRDVIDEKGADAARKTCKECLSTGLYNWSTMAAKLAQEEAARKEAEKEKKAGSRFALWSKAKEEEAEGGRWVAEEGVVRERIRRTRGLLEETTPQENFLTALFKV
ncbi:uncharacterized protein DNG_02698 [Cephalotrichum gorgonifer]|uniref:MFS maltose permease n=1 Tax=Cephalotrichum gorgonifer TaxID=2041049 RepID=A0AAE8SSW5_9PEZI|nr:uncharacterized protein DNG_02698 [Cephalotrichum gorgonifer]